MHPTLQTLTDPARDNGVTFLYNPRHCTHRLQALDVIFVKSLSKTLRFKSANGLEVKLDAM